MDPLSLVEDGVKGLTRIADAFRSRGLRFVGLYLIKDTGHAGDETLTIRLITDVKGPDEKRKMIATLVDLRRERALPWIDSSIGFDLVHIDDPEASRVIEYAQRLGGPFAIIRDTMWQGLFIEYAAVAVIPARDMAAA